MATERDILDVAAKHIAQAQKQRDKARRELSRARAVIRELLQAYRADYESDGADDGLEYKGQAYERAEHFLSKGKRK